MTPEEKAAIAAAGKAGNGKEVAKPEEANADEVAPEPIAGTDAAEADSEDHSQPDYEALLKAERERADAAEAAAADLAYKARRGKREERGEEPEAEDDDKPMTRAEAREFMAQQSATLQKNAQETAALQIARANTATEAEAQAAVLFYKTRVTPTGNLEDDVLFAIGGLNRKRSTGKAVELARALKSKDTALHSTSVVHRSTGVAGEPKISAQDAAAIKQSGMVWDGKLRAYKKPLGNGAKSLFYDPISKRRWTGPAS